MRILIVDNDPALRARLDERFHGVGYDVDVSDGTDDVQTLLAKASDIALVDRMLEDDAPTGDAARGEALAVALHEAGVYSVLFTAYQPGMEATYNLLRHQRIGGLCDKLEVRYELTDCLAVYERTRRFPNGAATFWIEGAGVDPVRVTSTHDWWRGILDALVWGGRPPAERAEELVALLRALIPSTASKVTLSRRPGGRSGAVMLKAHVGYGDGPAGETLAVKVGARHLIEGETIRYDRLVGPLPDGAAAHLRWRAETDRLGAVAYTWVSDPADDVLPFGPRDAHPLPWRRRRSAVQHLFSRSLDPWYDAFRTGEAAPAAAAESVVEHYAAKGGIWYDDVSLDRDVSFPPKGTKMSRSLSFRATPKRWDFPDRESFPNPVRTLQVPPLSELTYAQQCPVHGDLHVKNIFVLPDDSPRLIDFGRTGMGHCCRDFAALETSILLTCVCEPNAGELRQAVRLLASSENLGDYIDYRTLKTGKSDVYEAIRCAILIRRAALDAIGSRLRGPRGMAEYCVAAALHFLKYASGRADECGEPEDAQEEAALRFWVASYGAALFTQRAATLAKLEVQ